MNLTPYDWEKPLLEAAHGAAHSPAPVPPAPAQEPATLEVAYDHCEQVTSIQLDQTAFQEAWAEGSAMTVEQAVGYALGERP